MKKILAVILVLAVLTLVGCAGTANVNRDDATSPSSEAQGTTQGTQSDVGTPDAQGTQSTSSGDPASEVQSNVQSGTSTTSTEAEFITKEKAKEIALNNANLKEKDIKNYKIELDFDDDTKVWEYEIEFDSGIKEYDYEIDAKTGKIIKTNSEIN